MLVLLNAVPDFRRSIMFEQIARFIEKLLLKRLNKKKTEVQRLRWNKAMLEARLEKAKRQQGTAD